MNSGGRVLPAAMGAELVALFNAEKWAQLEQLAGKVTTQYPRQLLGWQALSKALLKLGKLPEAIDALFHITKLAPRDADAYNGLGVAFLAQGQLQEAETHYRRAIALDPKFAQAHSNLGNILRTLGRFKEAEAFHLKAVEIDPTSPVSHNNLGSVQREMNQVAEAETSFRRSLALQPQYLDALINLGTTLGDLVRWDEAKAIYRVAIRLHPNSGVAFNTLGRALSRLTGEDGEAEACLQRAIALNAADSETYAELGNIFMRKQQTDVALDMFRRSQDLRLLRQWRANQEHSSFSALFLDTPMAGSTPVGYLAGRADYDRYFYCLIPSGREDMDLIRSKTDVVFNMISNADQGAEILQLACDFVDRLGLPIINHPRRVMDTDRESIAQRLGGIPHCVVPKTMHVSSSALLEAAACGQLEGFALPLLVRTTGTYGGDDFEKCESWPEVSEYVSKRTETNFYVIAYIDYRSADGFFRKYRIIFMDGEIWPYHLAIHDHWMVHHFRTDMANQTWMRKEEEQFLDNMNLVFNAEHRDALCAIGKASGLEYCGIDCGLDADGRVVVFEANASMLVHDEKNAIYAYKNPYIAKIKVAFDAMLSRHRRVAARVNAP